MKAQMSELEDENKALRDKLEAMHDEAEKMEAQYQKLEDEHFRIVRGRPHCQKSGVGDSVALFRFDSSMLSGGVEL